MAENNAVCSICGKEYYACLSCHDSIKANPWKAFTDTSEHYKIFQVIRGFSTKVYNKEEAKARLENINLDDMNSFMPHIKKIIKDIIKEEKPIVKVVKEAVEEIKEPVEEKTIEETVIGKPNYSRKRNYKVEAE